jgi:hypothetical protein
LDFECSMHGVVLLIAWWMAFKFRNFITFLNKLQIRKIIYLFWLSQQALRNDVLYLVFLIVFQRWIFKIIF